MSECFHFFFDDFSSSTTTKQFAKDVKLGERWLYGGDVKADQNSAKAAGHELKGLEVLLKESEGKIQVPLMMSIDHQGNLSFPFLFFFF